MFAGYRKVSWKKDKSSQEDKFEGKGGKQGEQKLRLPCAVFHKVVAPEEPTARENGEREESGGCWLGSKQGISCLVTGPRHG